MKLFSRVMDKQCNINEQVGFAFWSTINYVASPTAFSLIFWSVCVFGWRNICPFCTITIQESPRSVAIAGSHFSSRKLELFLPFLLVSLSFIKLCVWEEGVGG